MKAGHSKWFKPSRLAVNNYIYIFKQNYMYTGVVKSQDWNLKQLAGNSLSSGICGLMR